MKTMVSVLLALLFIPVVYAQEEEFPPPLETDRTSFSAGIGMVTVDGEQWQRISFRPDIPIWRFGVALDIELFIDSKGNFSKKGWDFSSGKRAFDSIARKIYYVRFGRPGENTYVKVGALDYVTIGYGLIMDGYRNTIFYPGVKKTGLFLDLRNLSSLGIGVQGFVNNFSDFSYKGAVVGGRLSFKPISSLGVPVLGDLELGASSVYDMNQLAGIDSVLTEIKLSPEQVDSLRKWGIPINDEGIIVKKEPFDADSTDAFGVYGFDVAIPVVRKQGLGITLYGQYARNVNDDVGTDAEGYGIAAPGIMASIGPVTARLEYRQLRDKFEANYFDEIYELERSNQDPETRKLFTKADSLRDVSVNGIFGNLGANLLDMVKAEVVYQDLKGGDDKDRRLYARAYLARNLLNNIPKLEGLMFYYGKNRIGTALLKEKDTVAKFEKDSFFEPTLYTIYGYKIGFSLTGGVVLVWNVGYSYTNDEEGYLKKERNFHIETMIRF